jgi:hypothetical protein
LLINLFNHIDDIMRTLTLELSMGTIHQYKQAIEQNNAIKSNTCHLPWLGTPCQCPFEY